MPDQLTNAQISRLLAAERTWAVPIRPAQPNPKPQPAKTMNSTTPKPDKSSLQKAYWSKFTPEQRRQEVLRRLALRRKIDHKLAAKPKPPLPAHKIQPTREHFIASLRSHITALELELGLARDFLAAIEPSTQSILSIHPAIS